MIALLKLVSIFSSENISSLSENFGSHHFLRAVCEPFDFQVKQDFLFSLFPFNIVFNRSMMITNVGNSLFEIMPDILNQPVDDIFKLVKPMASLTWETVGSFLKNSLHMASFLLKFLLKCSHKRM